MNLRTLLTGAAVMGALTAAATAATAQGLTQSASASASVTIVNPVTVTKVTDLAFGTIAKPVSGSSTVTVASAAATAATPTFSAGSTAYAPTTGGAHAADFHLTGNPNQTYSISSSSLTFTNAAGNLTNIGSEAPVSASSSSVGVLPGTATDDLYVGGHFDISSNTALGTYTGTLALTVQFN